MLRRRPAARRARRPPTVGSAGRRGAPPAARPRPTGRPPGATRGRTTPLAPTLTTTPDALAARIDTALFPSGPPPLPDTLQDHHDRMDMAWAISVLMGHRDLVRRLAAEAGGRLTP